MLPLGINDIENINYRYLLDSYNGINLQYGLSGTISKYITYGFYADQNIYHDIPEQPEVDDKYWIGNFDLNFNITNKISFNNGLRFDNYEDDEKSEYIGFFSNFSWEFKRECYLYFGYKTSLDKIDNVYQENYQKLYIKISYNF